MNAAVSGENSGLPENEWWWFRKKEPSSDHRDVFRHVKFVRIFSKRNSVECCQRCSLIVNCGNANLMGKGESHALELAYVLLFWTGMVGLAGMARTKRIYSRK